MYLLDNVSGDGEDIEEDHEYVIKDEMILLKGEFDLECDGDEASIRSELKKVFLSKFPQITAKDFDFVRRDRNTISTPVVKEGHTWDCAHVKHLCGAGKLYVRLNVSKDIIMEKDDGSDIELPPAFILDEPTGPSTSGGISSVDSKIDSLTALFPSAKRSDINYVVTM